MILRCFYRYISDVSVFLFLCFPAPTSNQQQQQQQKKKLERAECANNNRRTSAVDFGNEDSVKRAAGT